MYFYSDDPWLVLVFFVVNLVAVDSEIRLTTHSKFLTWSPVQMQEQSKGLPKAKFDVPPR